MKVESKGLEQTDESWLSHVHGLLVVLRANRMLTPYHHRLSYRRQTEGEEECLDTTSGLPFFLLWELCFVGQSILLRIIL